MDVASKPFQIGPHAVSLDAISCPGHVSDLWHPVLVDQAVISALQASDITFVVKSCVESILEVRPPKSIRQYSARQNGVQYKIQFVY